jgi:hypothetical protein
MITPAIIRDFIADQNIRVNSATADDSLVTVRALFTSWKLMASFLTIP